MDKEKLVKEYLDTIAFRLSADYGLSLEDAYNAIEDLDLLNAYKDDYDFLLHEDISTWVDIASDRYYKLKFSKPLFLTPTLEQAMESVEPKEVEPNNRLKEGKEALKEFKSMAKCDCYFEQEVIDPFLYDRRLVGCCNGVKERDVCRCCGNPAMCDFYPEKREEVRRKRYENHDKKELKFYRTWIKEHNLEELAEKAFKEWEEK